MITKSKWSSNKLPPIPKRFPECPDAWKVFGIKPTNKRQRVVDRYHYLMKTRIDKRLIEFAYGRLINELFHSGAYG